MQLTTANIQWSLYFVNGHINDEKNYPIMIQNQIMKFTNEAWLTTLDQLWGQDALLLKLYQLAQEVLDSAKLVADNSCVAVHVVLQSNFSR